MSEARRSDATVRSAPGLVIISGESGSGKTTLCNDAIRLARARGLAVAGLMTRAHTVAGRKAAMFVQNVQTGEERLLGQYVDVTGDPLIEHWQFSDEGIAWGAQVLQETPPCDILIVDELGPLELVYNKGWHAAIGVLLARRCRMALVSVRPLLVTELTTVVAEMNPVTLIVNQDSYPGLLAQLRQWIEAIRDSC
jgi:nucleoside-triphosphatase THEP1